MGTKKLISKVGFAFIHVDVSHNLNLIIDESKLRRG